MFLFPFSRFASSHADFRGINFDNSVISIGPYGGTGSLSLRGIFQSQVTAQPTPMAKIIPPPVDSLLTDIYRESQREPVIWEFLNNIPKAP